MSFRLIPHDPRQMAKCKKSWADNAGKRNWKYDPAEMEEDLYHHRLGKNPALEMIVQSIPIFDEKDIPKTGSLQKKKTGYVSSREEYCTDRVQGTANDVSADETEAVIMQDDNDKAVLLELFRGNASVAMTEEAVCVAVGTSTRHVSGSITSTWNRKTRTG